jgi:hypothetical protein|tara:strand:- start:590 stop:796 length:207 start_codon:yes stop_codon:yes gene_type:complete
MIKFINALGSLLLSILMIFAQLPFVIFFGAVKSNHNSTDIMFENLKTDELKKRGIVVVDANSKYTGIN